MSNININQIIQEINNVNSTEQLDELRLKYLGKNGTFTAMLKTIATLSVEEKKTVGASINKQKITVETELKNRLAYLQQQQLNEQIKKDKIDLSLNTQPTHTGGLHPITATMHQLISIFGTLGYSIASANEIETDWYNFSALNIPAHHPARQNHDTFYVNQLDDTGKPMLLRTHTSNTQIHTMQQYASKDNFAPIKIISPGKTYRSDSDATHSPMFHQIELLNLDYAHNISVPKLKATIMYFLTKFFNNNNLNLRFRPSYFPFTSPSFEVDIQCSKTKDAIIIGQGNDWLEILGCGIVNPNVISNCGLNNTIYKGIALGAGIERLAMLKYNLKDLRHMFEGDVRWLNYYNFGSVYNASVFGGLN